MLKHDVPELFGIGHAGQRERGGAGSFDRDFADAERIQKRATYDREVVDLVQRDFLLFFEKQAAADIDRAIGQNAGQVVKLFLVEEIADQ